MRVIAQIPFHCRCGGAFPCARRRWWNAWRHYPSVDIVAWIEQEKKKAAAMREDVRMLTGAEK